MQQPEHNSAAAKTTQKKYYPKDRDGNYDEWAAVLKTQHETANRMHRKMEKEKRQMMANEFGKG